MRINDRNESSISCGLYLRNGRRRARAACGPDELVVIDERHTHMTHFSPRYRRRDRIAEIFDSCSVQFVERGEYARGAKIFYMIVTQIHEANVVFVQNGGGRCGECKGVIFRRTDDASRAFRWVRRDRAFKIG